jgi:hypothetical protein
MAESTSAMADIDWDAIFEIDFVEESDCEDENSDSEDDGLPINEGMLFPIVKLGCFGEKLSKFVLTSFPAKTLTVYI